MHIHNTAQLVENTDLSKLSVLLVCLVYTGTTCSLDRLKYGDYTDQNSTHFKEKL